MKKSFFVALLMALFLVCGNLPVLNAAQWGKQMKLMPHKKYRKRLGNVEARLMTVPQKKTLNYIQSLQVHFRTPGIFWKPALVIHKNKMIKHVMYRGTWEGRTAFVKIIQFGPEVKDPQNGHRLGWKWVIVDYKFINP